MDLLLGTDELIRLSNESLLDKPLDQIDLGPFIYPIFPDKDLALGEDLLESCKKSLEDFKSRRVLVISWLLAISIGITGNISASAFIGGIQGPRYDLGILFLIITIGVGLVLIWYFPPNFTHVISIQYEETVEKVRNELHDHFEGRVHAYGIEWGLWFKFLRIYNALLIRDYLRRSKLKTVKIKRVLISSMGFAVWLDVGARGKLSWLSRHIESRLLEELVDLCYDITMCVTALLSINLGSSDEKLSTFLEALHNLKFEHLMVTITRQITQIK